MLEYILSKDYREYLEKNEIELSDWDKATLIYNHIFLTHDEKMKILTQLKENSNDVYLKEQLAERVFGDEFYYQEFKENTGNAYYVLTTKDEKDYTEENVFLTFDAAYEDGIRTACDFYIQKHLLKCRENHGDIQGVFGTVSYDSKGALGNLFALYRISDEECLTRINNKRFENRYLDWPTMFQEKDIVHIIGTDMYGIVDEISKHNKPIEILDYSDFQIPVKLIFKGQTYLSISMHDHYHPTELEYARLEENDTRKGFMEYMVKTIYLSSWFSGTIRSKGRIKEILSQLEKLWEQYPDLRLGQLLLSLVGTANLFVLEDEKLLEKIQENM